jgi:hypothetical protein
MVKTEAPDIMSELMSAIIPSGIGSMRQPSGREFVKGLVDELGLPTNGALGVERGKCGQSDARHEHEERPPEPER